MTQSNKLDEFFAENYTELKKMVRYIVRSHVTPDDITTILSGWYIKMNDNRQLLKYDPKKGSFSTYIFISLKTHIFTSYYHHRKHPTLISDGTIDRTTVDTDETYLIDIRCFLTRLSGVDSIIANELYNGRETTEIAKTLGITQAGVLHYRNRIRGRWTHYIKKVL
jgi:DNA-directed RNA polymerase specialized sigma24 family protein